MTRAKLPSWTVLYDDPGRETLPIYSFNAEEGAETKAAWDVIPKPQQEKCRIVPLGPRRARR